MNIDIHTHYVPTESLKAAAEIGKRRGLKLDKDEHGREVVNCDGHVILRQLKPEFSDLNMRMSLMDRQGIDMQVLSPASSYFFYRWEATASLEYAQWLNRRLADAVKVNPKRFVALGSVPMQDSAKAAAELEIIITNLGFRGVEISSNINGRYFDDSAFDPFWEAAQGLNALIFVHPNAVAGAERMKDYNLANLIGNPTDTSLAVAKCIFGGVLERFPRLKFLLAHAGGFLPYTWGRLDRGFKVANSANLKITKAPSDYLKLFYFDTITHSTVALEYLIANFSAAHVLLGSDYPYDMGDPEPVESLRSISRKSEELEQISSGNACRLLGIGV